MNEGKVFVDTNVLAYSIDRRYPGKMRRARDLLRGLAEGGNGVISTQVMQELFVVATRKLGVDPVHAKRLLVSLQNYEVVTLTPQLVLEAVDCSLLERMSLWDSMIVVAADSASCAVLATEDLTAGRTIRGVRVEDPFAMG